MIAALVLSLGTRAAWAQEQTGESDKPGAEPAQGEDTDDDEPGFTHKGQVGLHLQGVMGYRSIVTYDKEFCGDLKDNGSANSSTCSASATP